MRLRHNPKAKDILLQHPDIVPSDPESWRGKWKACFGGLEALHVEIGVGKGRFIAEIAKRYPNIGFIGLELAESVIVQAVKQVAEEGISNIKLLNHRAEDLLFFFSENEIARMYLNFSDPWPKKRHEKRRLTYPVFLALYERVLQPGGRIELKTDNRDFLEYSLNSFGNYGMTVENVNDDLHRDRQGNNMMTEYEKKFSEKGYPIYKCEVFFSKKLQKD